MGLFSLATKLNQVEKSRLGNIRPPWERGSIHETRVRFSWQIFCESPPLLPASMLYIIHERKFSAHLSIFVTADDPTLYSCQFKNFKQSMCPLNRILIVSLFCLGLIPSVSHCSCSQLQTANFVMESIWMKTSLVWIIRGDKVIYANSSIVSAWHS